MSKGFVLKVGILLISLLLLVFIWRLLEKQDYVTELEPEIANTQAYKKPSVVVIGDLPQANTTFRENQQQDSPAEVFTRLESLRASVNEQKPLDDKSLKRLYDSVSQLQATNQINPFHALDIKQWLLSLMPSENTKLKQEFEQEKQQLTQETMQAIRDEEQARKQDKQFLDYKEQEAKILKEVLDKYPNDEEKAAIELQKRLDALRAQVYN